MIFLYIFLLNSITSKLKMEETESKSLTIAKHSPEEAGQPLGYREVFIFTKPKKHKVVFFFFFLEKQLQKRRIYFGQEFILDKAFEIRATMCCIFLYFQKTVGSLKITYLECHWGQHKMVQLDLSECVYAVLFSEPSLIKNMHVSLRAISFAAF